MVSQAVTPILDGRFGSACERREVSRLQNKLREEESEDARLGRDLRPLSSPKDHHG